MASPKGGSSVEPGMLSRIGAGIRYALTGNADFFGPGTPIAPVAQEQAHGRAWDFPAGVNLTTQPRSDEPITFAMLRALADNFDLLRLAIETRKDQMGKLRWQIQREDDGTQDETALAIQKLLREPDREHDFLDWFRMLLEDLLVIDAPAVYIRPTLGGEVYALEQLDGATIKRVLDTRGRTPAPPAEGEAFDAAKHTAYQQIIKGIPATDYHANELVYKPRNPRVHKVYGFSPVEQIVFIVNIGLRRQAHQLAFYTAGNVPDMLMAAPATWSLDQIAAFQKYWDLLMAGDLEARRQLRMIPGDMKPMPLRPETSLFDMFDEWIARVVCYCFSLPPSAFVKQQNRATAETAQEAALEEGLSPLMEWTVSFMNRLIRKGFKAEGYVFAWADETSLDPLVQAQVDQIYVSTGIRLPNEVRDDHGWESNPVLDERKLAPPAPPPGSTPPKSGDSTESGDAQKEKAKDDTAEKVAAAVAAQLAPLHAAAADRSGLETLGIAIAELRRGLDAMQAASVPTPSVTQIAEALGKMVDSGVPLNQALKASGFDFTVPGGDVALVPATRIPLALAADGETLLPPPAPPAPIAKRAAPAPVPQPITINVTIPPAASVSKHVTFTRNEKGELLASDITDAPAAPASPTES